jgi:hypothetical protein
VFPFALMILRVPGNALLLRVAWTERHDFRAKRAEVSVSLASSCHGHCRIADTRNLFKKAQFIGPSCAGA